MPHVDLLGPIPIADFDDREYWAGCARGEFMLQRCADCKAFRHPPRPMCPKCRSMRAEWVASKGAGEVHSYTVVHHPSAPALREAVPYGIVLVEMDEGPRIISNMIDVPPGDLHIGMRVRVAFREVAPGVALPKFERAG